MVARKDADAAAPGAPEAQAGLVQARHMLAQGVLRSPISGVVSRVDAALNAMADPAQPLVEVVDPRGLQLVFSVPPDQAGRIHPGTEVRVSSGRAGSGGLLGTGRVTGISAVIDTVSGSVDVRATLVNPLGGLFAGEDVSGLFTVEQSRAAVAVPAEALVPAGDGLQLFVIDAQGVAHARPVTVGARSGNAVQIASGLRGGETVAVSGAYGLQDGARVRRASSP
jgi:RND family efflux transporter MFP subunit